ncbi:AAA family ATPase [Megalodesulfovibrio paquesii]
MKGEEQKELTVCSLGELLDMDLPVREHLICPWLQDGESALIYAPTGLGKSMFTFSLCLAIAGQGKFLGWDAPKPRSVLYVDGEMHIADIQKRARMLVKTIEGIDLQKAEQNLDTLARNKQDAKTGFPDLAEEKGQGTLFEMTRKGPQQGELKGKPYDLVVLDNLSTLASIEDENAASAFNDILKLLMKFKQAGIACILVHHTGKNKTSFRGSSKLGTTFEVILKLGEAGNNLLDDKGLSFILEWEKYRQERDERTRPLEVRLTKDVFNNEPKWEHGLPENYELQKLVAAVRTLQYINQTEVGKALGWDQATVSRKKRAAIQAKLITEAAWKECLDEARSLRNGESEEPGEVDEDL